MPEAALARRIYGERKERGWSLADLADRSGVSKAALSKIERGETSPTATNLVKVASAFGLTFAGLLLRAERATEAVSRRAQQPTWADPESGYTRRQVFAASDHPLEIAEVELPPGARVAFPAASYARIRHVIWVQEGLLALHEGDRVHRLEAGDCLGLGEPDDVTFSNETSRPCRYNVILTRI